MGPLPLHGRFPLGTLLLALQWGREALGAERQFLLAAAQRVEDWRREARANPAQLAWWALATTTQEERKREKRFLQLHFA